MKSFFSGPANKASPPPPSSLAATFFWDFFLALKKVLFSQGPGPYPPPPSQWPRHKKLLFFAACLIKIRNIFQKLDNFLFAFDNTHYEKTLCGINRIFLFLKPLRTGTYNVFLENIVHQRLYIEQSFLYSIIDLQRRTNTICRI